MTTFKIGDRIRLPLEKPTTFMSNPGWAEEMYNYLGKETKITCLTHKNMYIVDVDGGYWYWHPSWCTLVEKGTPEKPINKVLARSLDLEHRFKLRQENKTKKHKTTVIHSSLEV